MTWSAIVHSIISGSQVCSSFFKEFLEGHGYTIDDEHCFSSTNGRSVKEDHPDFRRHATSMRPGSQG